jgi:hypothetical protein
MSEDSYRVLPVKSGRIACQPDRDETLDHCRFCVFSRYFLVKGRWIKSPALAFCAVHRATEEVDLKCVESVKCGDRTGEGFRSIMNVIS